MIPSVLKVYVDSLHVQVLGSAKDFGITGSSSVFFM